MKVLSRKGIMLDVLRKNIRMLWKLNKSLQLSVIKEELFLVEFEDERDKRRVLEMSPWHYEKQCFFRNLKENRIRRTLC